MQEITAPRNTSGHAPQRRSGSVRRTASIDVTWPDGHGTAMHLDARARDIYTPDNGPAAQQLGADRYRARVAIDRSILELQCVPDRAHASRLVGTKGGGHLRKILTEVLPQDFAQGSPLYLLLDDLSGVSLVAGWAWTRWPQSMAQSNADSERFLQVRQRILAHMEGVCIGFKPGSTSLDDRTGSKQNSAQVMSLTDPADADGWHSMPPGSGQVSMRRARRIDVWLADGIQVDAMFQDSSSTPCGGRAAVHEYTLMASVNADGLLTKIEAVPRVLPYVECPSAIHNIQRLIGTPVRALRQTVLDQLPGIQGCTHLNDALRSLAEVPLLADKIPR